MALKHLSIDFLVIGAAKSATTWLQNSLQNTPAIFMPDPELHFFSREYERGLEWYISHFPHKTEGRLLGEKSNSYLTDPRAAKRIRNACPDVRLVLQMRNPVARAYSDYCMLYRRGSVSDDIDCYLNPDRAADDRFIKTGCYAHHVKPYLKLFPSESLLPLFFERIQSAPEEQLAQFARHIGYDGHLAPSARRKVKDRNADMVPLPLRRALRPLRPVLDPLRETALVKAVRRVVANPVIYPKITDGLVKKLTAYYQPDVEELEEIFGVQLDGWLAEMRL